MQSLNKVVDQFTEALKDYIKRSFEEKNDVLATGMDVSQDDS